MKDEAAGAIHVPPLFDLCPTEAVLVMIVEMLERLTTHNDNIPVTQDNLTRFHSRAVPGSMQRIQRLDAQVVNRIAAGEIIQRPANAIKEMIENSLDAGSSSIQVSVKDGGLKVLQIQDNGHGVCKEDMPLLCERFATSKLRQFDDLSTIATYGFRGEALASISHIAHVTVITKTADSPCAWKAVYLDGKMSPTEPKPIAGNNGTQITAEDLFYNVPARRKSLKSPTEEYNKVMDIINRYAIHNNNVSFTCKKVGSNTPDIRTVAGGSKVDAIRQIYGSAVANELLEVSCEDDKWEFSMEGLVTNANFNVKKMQFLLFINSEFTRPKSPTQVDILLLFRPERKLSEFEERPENLDVNVHPTKHEVLLIV
ncbi:DNA mismatch repair protein [Chytridiales sp. JEL 0842]|nr:DNA mismatch repair protein [Chytridiales sp. JEL 0842]